MATAPFYACHGAQRSLLDSWEAATDQLAQGRSTVRAFESNDSHRRCSM